jgi:putative endonuclease
MTRFHSPTQQLGNKVEKLVCAYLQTEGLTLITENFFTPFGELDLIMQDGKTLAFIEVRYRKSSLFGNGAESVTRSKQRKIIRSALCYLQKHPTRQGCRFDVVTVQPADHEVDIDWIKGAFQVQ